MCNRFYILAIGALSLSLFAAAAQARVDVRAVDDGWYVKASGEPLTGVLGAIAKSAGIKVSGTTKLVDDPVITGVYQGDLETILPRLLRGADYAFESAATAQGGSRITRLVVLSGIKGKAPKRAVKTARRLPPAQQPARPLTPEEKQQGERVTALLTQRARLGGGMQPAADRDDSRNGGGTGITRNPDGSFDISPEAQARMAEATRKAQQNLQALVAAIRRNERNQNSGN